MKQQHNATLIVLATFLTLGVLSERAFPATTDEPLENLNVSYGVLSCPTTGNKHMLYAEARGLTLGNVYYEKISYSEPSVAGSVTFEVVPDAYYISASRDDSDCNAPAGVTTVVLPGHPVTSKVELSPLVGDSFSGSNVAGVIESGLHVRLLVSPKLSCSSHVDLALLKPLDAEIKPGTYYADLDNSVFYDRTVVLAFGDSTKSALVLLPVRQNGSVSITSTYLRFDATRAALDKDASERGVTLSCPLPIPTSTP